jgi:hypothetical protein
MNMWDDDPDRIEAAIDDVARRMTEGAPGAGFKARVFARIGAAHAPLRASWLLAPLAVTAVVLIAVMAYRGRSVDHGGTSSTAAGVVSGTADTVRSAGERATERQGGIVATPPERAARDGAALARSRGPGHLARSVAPSPAPNSEVTGLAPPALQIGSIDVDRIAQPDPISIDRLETSSIALAPIGEGDRP